MRKFLATLTAAVLLCALLAACGSTPSDTFTATAAPPATATPVPTVTPAPTPEPTPAPATLTDELDAVLGYEADSAGGSLKSAQVAAALVSYFAATPAPDDLADQATAWYDALSEDDKALVALNWQGISDTARALADDAAAQADLLESAGVTTDFTTLDLTGIPAAFDALDAAFAA